VRRSAHNPEVAGSNPAPATSFRRSGPFPSGRGAFCVLGTVVKRVAATALRAARQRDGGDGVTRDETAWTWWTLPPAIAGCLAQRYRKCIPVSSRSCWTSRNMRSPGSGRGRQRLVVASGCHEREIRPCSSSTTASRDAAVPVQLRISSNARCPRSGFVLAGRACNRRYLKSALGCLRCSFTGLFAASWTRYLKWCLRRTGSYVTHVTCVYPLSLPLFEF
jgi:hypothetical protein